MDQSVDSERGLVAAFVDDGIFDQAHRHRTNRLGVVRVLPRRLVISCRTTSPSSGMTPRVVHGRGWPLGALHDAQQYVSWSPRHGLEFRFRYCAGGRAASASPRRSRWCERFDPEEAIAWRAAGVTNPGEARSWRIAGVDAGEVAGWRDAGIGFAEAAAWREFEYPLEEAKKLKAEGKTPSESVPAASCS